MESVTKLHRSSAIQAYRDLLVRDFHPLVIRAARAHAVLQKMILLPNRAERRPSRINSSAFQSEGFPDELNLAKYIAFRQPLHLPFRIICRIS